MEIRQRQVQGTTITDVFGPGFCLVTAPAVGQVIELAAGARFTTRGTVFAGTRQECQAKRAELEMESRT